METWSSITSVGIMLSATYAAMIIGSMITNKVIASGGGRNRELSPRSQSLV